MQIKNISSTTIELPEFQLSLKPGDVADLSSFETKLIHTNQRLNALFEKGLLLNLGQTIIKNSKKALDSTKQRIDKLNLGSYVVKEASPSSKNSTRNLINSALSGSERKPIPKSSEAEIRYQQQYQQNTFPAEDLKVGKSPSKKVEIQQQFNPVEITPTGLVTSFGSYGIIPTEQLVGSTTYLNQIVVPNEIEQLENQNKDQIEIQDKLGNKHQISLKNIEKIAQRRCIGFNKNGKPCKKWTVIGFDTCPIHMSSTDKITWEKQRQSPSS